MMISALKLRKNSSASTNARMLQRRVCQLTVCRTNSGKLSSRV